MKSIPAFLFFLFLSTYALGQNQGIIVCQGRSGVPAWEMPGSLAEVKQLNCGQNVTIIGLDRGFVKVQINEKLIGYIEAQYVQSSGDQIIPEQPKIQAKEQTQEEAPSQRQAAIPLPERQSEKKREYPMAEIFGGYSYANADINIPGARQSLNGWEFSLSGNINKYLAAEGSVAGYYKKYNIATGGFLGLPPSIGFSVNDYAFMFGPRFNYGPIFAHALFGTDRIAASVLGVSGSEWSFAQALGGGVQVPASKSISVRVSMDYFLTRHSDLTQNNFRISAGLVFGVGKRNQ